MDRRVVSTHKTIVNKREGYVIKIFNSQKELKRELENYALLRRIGLTTPEVMQVNGLKIVMTYEGKPLKANKEDLTSIIRIISQIHSTNTKDMTLPRRPEIDERVRLIIKNLGIVSKNVVDEPEFKEYENRIRQLLLKAQKEDSVVLRDCTTKNLVRNVEEITLIDPGRMMVSNPAEDLAALSLQHPNKEDYILRSYAEITGKNVDVLIDDVLISKLEIGLEIAAHFKNNPNFGRIKRWRIVRKYSKPFFKDYNEFKEQLCK